MANTVKGERQTDSEREERERIDNERQIWHQSGILQILHRHTDCIIDTTFTRDDCNLDSYCCFKNYIYVQE